MTVYAITGFVPNIQNLVQVSISNQTFLLLLLTLLFLFQILGASILPGSPQTNMYFTLYGYNTVEQARGLVRDLKMGQYTKLPPRVTFTVQCMGAIIVRV